MNFGGLDRSRKKRKEVKMKSKEREHAEELVQALLWVRRINDVFDGVDGLRGFYYVSVEFVPSSDPWTHRDDFTVRFLNNVLFSTADDVLFDSKEVERVLDRELDHVVQSLTLHRNALKKYLGGK
jgi:hypothetical protein